jgi:hypothetical protein
MVTTALEERAGAATAIAVIVTLAELGTTAGAAYRPDDDMVPHAEPAHPEPATDQRTLVFVVPVTVAVNCCC